jgi:molybdate transport system ATP-binding protein
VTPPAAQREHALEAHVVVERPGGFRLDAAVSVAAGEVLAVLGPNGAGKTTVLRAIAGLVPLSGGRIAVGGDVWDDPAAGAWRDVADRAAGLVFQDYRLFPHLSALDNVAFGPRARGTGRHAARAAAAEWLDRVGLGDVARQRPAELSGGQAQRVALARALAAGPALLLLDEPLAALDARTRLELRGELRRYLEAFAGPSLVVTHDPLDALVLADRIVVLEGGRVAQEGAPADVARHPATQYVARLMGLNLYRGRVTGDGRVELDGGGSLVAAAAGPGEVPRAGARVLVAVPPSAVTLHTEHPPAGSPRNVWRGTVSGVELLTDRVRVAVAGTPPALADITPAALAELGLEPGREVWLSAKATETAAYADPAAGVAGQRE